MKLKNIFVALTVSVMLFSGCGENSAENETSEAVSQASSESVSQVTELTEEEKKVICNGVFPQLEKHVDGEINAVMKTNKGDISLRLFPNMAPKAVENFVTHAKEGYYNGVIFHRVIKDFMIQGGDPTGTGRGGESIWGEDFENEVSASMRHFRGALCMAKTEEPISNGSQFYIVQNPKINDSEKKEFEDYLNRQEEYLTPESAIKVKDIYPPEIINEYIKNGGYPYLDGNYTVFGQVSAGMEVVDAIASVQTDSNNKPLEEVKINSIEIK